MYHYVCDLENSRYPKLQGLKVSKFEKQLSYLEKYYCLVSLQEVLTAVLDKNDSLPSNALLLTFDDGFRGHFENVFPVLRKKGIKGVFFPIAKPVCEDIVLDVHKIHFILASVDNPSKLTKKVKDFVNTYRNEYALEPIDIYLNRWAHAGRWDSPETMFVKRMLQKGLSEEARDQLVQQLFIQFVTHDETAFSRQLYASAEEIQVMYKAGMDIGVHSYSHRWLNTLSPEEQEQEIDLSHDFLSELDISLENWTICYPFGGYNKSLLGIVREKKCAIGFASNTNLAYLDHNDQLLLPRLDTNDLPSDPQASVNGWTRKILDMT